MIRNLLLLLMSIQMNSQNTKIDTVFVMIDKINISHAAGSHSPDLVQSLDNLALLPDSWIGTSKVEFFFWYE